MNARLRRKIHFAFLLVWLGPGAYVSFTLRHSLVWVIVMSWYAIVATHLAAFSAETPVESEES